MPPLRVCRVPATGQHIPSSPRKRLRSILAAVALLCTGPSARADGLKAWSEPPPPFTLPALDRTHHTLDPSSGVLVIVHVFATWCEPCRTELIALDEFHKAVPPGTLRLLAIAAGEPEARVRRYFAANPVGFPVLLDTDGAVTKSWGASMYPTTFVLRPGLVPALKAEGEVDWADPSLLQQLTASHSQPARTQPAR